MRRSPSAWTKILRSLRRPAIRRSTLCGFAAALVLTGCSGSGTSGSCAFVSRRHLSAGPDGDGKTLVCSPLRVLSAHRDKYFPDSSPDSGADRSGS